MRRISGTRMFSDRKDEGDVMETRLSSNAFQILAAATGKARLPTVDSLKGGTTRRLVPEERSERRPDISVTRLSGPRYRGTMPQRTLWVSTAILNSTRSGTRSQCRHISASLMRKYSVVSTSRARQASYILL